MNDSIHAIDITMSESDADFALCIINGKIDELKQIMQESPELVHLKFSKQAFERIKDSLEEALAYPDGEMMDIDMGIEE